MEAVAPGRAMISILFSMADFIISSPGSDTPGIPASVIRAIFSPDSNFSISISPLAFFCCVHNRKS